MGPPPAELVAIIDELARHWRTTVSDQYGLIFTSIIWSAFGGATSTVSELAVEMLLAKKRDGFSPLYLTDYSSG